MDSSRAAPTLVSRYLPRPTIEWLVTEPGTACREVDGSLVFADVSGFTALSERLAAQGRIGAEILADTISACFSRLLAAAYANGGSLLKFGGDALLLLFNGDDHCRRAVSAAAGMRRELRNMGPISGDWGRARLSMSVGVHTGTVHLFLVGDGHRELVVTGPAASSVVRMESTADRGEIVVSRAVVEHLEPACLGTEKGDGFLLRREPAGLLGGAQASPVTATVEQLLPALPAWLRTVAVSDVEDPQHRSIAVGFCKFSGVDALLSEVGVGATADVLHAFVADVQAAADRHGVTFLASDVDVDGGKIVLAGGAPVTSGADEEGVLLAAREVLAVPRPLQVKIGVNAGPAFAGDIGPAYRRTYTVMGDTVNVAARVMAHAEYGAVMATTEVLDRCRTNFVTRDVPPFNVKGKTLPLRAAVVTDVRARTQEGNVRPLIGRDRELQELMDAWQSASRGHGRAVVIVGEPGIGKTRLLEEARARAQASVAQVVCEPYDANTAYSAVRQVVLEALAIDAAADDDTVVEALERTVTTRAPRLQPWLPLIARVCGIDLPTTPQVRDLDERFFVQRLEQSVLDLLEAVVVDPIFVVIDDAHWMDEPSTSLLMRGIARLERLPWLICTSRREVNKGLRLTVGGPVTEMMLSGLHPNATAALAETLAEELAHLDEQVLSRLVERSGGNPLFLNELMATAGSFGAAEELPESLEAVILNRIDGLPPAERSLLRRLSVFGGSFAHSIAAEVLGDALPPAADRRWRRLRDFIDISQDERLTFRHALLMEGAYRSLPFRVRESLHGAVGDALERGAGPTTDDVAELLSQHFFHARRYDAAWRYSKVAAERAQAVFANAETARFYERALDAARHGVQVAPVELFRVHESLGDTLKRLGRLADAERAYARARRIDPGSSLALSNLALKRAQVRQQSGQFVQAMRWLRQAEQILDGQCEQDVVRQRARLAVARASIAKDRLRPREIVRWAEAALAHAAASPEPDLEAHASLLLDHGLVTSGRPQLAVHSRRALQLFEQSSNLWGQGVVLNNMGVHAYWNGQWERAVDLYTRARTILERIGDVPAAAGGLDNVGEIRSDQGRYAEAEELFVEALAIRERVQDRAKIAYAMSNLGRLRTRQGHFDEALSFLSQARAMSQSVGVTWDAVEAAVRTVECFLHMGDFDAGREMAFALLGDRAPDRAQQATLHRLLGYADLRAGDARSAADELEVSLRDASEVGLAIEEAMTLRALGHLETAVGRDPLPLFTQAQGLLEALGVVAVAEPDWLVAQQVAVPLQSSRRNAEPVQSSS